MSHALLGEGMCSHHAFSRCDGAVTVQCLSSCCAELPIPNCATLPSFFFCAFRDFKSRQGLDGLKRWHMMAQSMVMLRSCNQNSGPVRHFDNGRWLHELSSAGLIIEITFLQAPHRTSFSGPSHGDFISFNASVYSCATGWLGLTLKSRGAKFWTLKTS